MVPKCLQFFLKVQKFQILLVKDFKAYKCKVTYTIMGNYVSMITSSTFTQTFHSFLMQQTVLAGFIGITTSISYQWEAGQWDRLCTANCGQAAFTQTRTVVCKNNSGKLYLAIVQKFKSTVPLLVHVCTAN